MPLVSIKRDKPKTKKEKERRAFEPEFPFGTTLTLDDEVLKKLGITELPEVGSKKSIIALATCTDVSARAFTDENGKKKVRRSVDLQITELAIEDPEDAKTAAEVIYGSE